MKKNYLLILGLAISLTMCGCGAAVPAQVAEVANVAESEDVADETLEEDASLSEDYSEISEEDSEEVQEEDESASSEEIIEEGLGGSDKTTIEGGRGAYDPDEANAELDKYYDKTITDIIKMSSSKMDLDFSKGAIDDFDGDGYNELALVYSVDSNNIRVCMSRLIEETGAVIRQDFEVCQMAGGVIVHIQYGEVDGEPSFVVWRDDVDGYEYFGDYLIFPLGGSELKMSRQISYDGDVYTENGKKVSSSQIKKLTKGLETLCSYSVSGTPIEELLSSGEGTSGQSGSKKGNKISRENNTGYENDNSGSDYDPHEELGKLYDDYLNDIIDSTTDNKMLKYSKGFVEDVDEDGFDEMGVVYSTDGKKIYAAFGWVDPDSNQYIANNVEIGSVEDFPMACTCYGVIDGIPSFAILIDVTSGNSSYGDVLVIPITGDGFSISKQYSYDCDSKKSSYRLNGKNITEADFSKFMSQVTSMSVFGEHGKGTPIKDMVPTYKK